MTFARSAFTARTLGLLVGGLLGSVALTACVTGERPRLVVDDSLPIIESTPSNEVAGILLDSPTKAQYTVTYSITTKFGGQQTVGKVVYDASLGTASIIGQERFVFTAEGKTATCSLITDDCQAGILDYRVSDRMMTARFFRDSTLKRIEQDSKIAVGDIVKSSADVFGSTEVCTEIPMVDMTGTTRTTIYCALEGLSIVSRIETADVLVEVTAIDDTADPLSFDTGTT